MFDLSGKRALITGASGGIGREIAIALHAQGADVVLSGTRESVLNSIVKTMGARSFSIPSDLSRSDGPKELIAEVKNILGTFTPPEQVVINVDFLQTLEEKDISSGIGEMIKVHAIDSPASFNLLSNLFHNSFLDSVSEYITLFDLYLLFHDFIILINAFFVKQVNESSVIGAHIFFFDFINK